MKRSHALVQGVRRRLAYAWSLVYRRQLEMEFPAEEVRRRTLSLPPLPQGYQLRAARAPDDYEAWSALLNEDGRFGHWTPDRVAAELAPAWPGSTHLIFHGDLLVGCASVIDASTKKERIGLGMYMIVKPEHRSGKLGRILTNRTLGCALDQGFTRLIVTTDPGRTEAVALYLSNGCTPVYSSVWSFVQWRRARRRSADVLRRRPSVSA